MKVISPLFIVCLFLWACTGAGSENGNADEQDKSAGLSGKEVYDQFCILCHGSNGKMAFGGAFDLTTSELPLEDRIVLVTEGRNTMTPFGGLLTEEEIKAVAEYSLQFREKK